MGTRSNLSIDAPESTLADDVSEPPIGLRRIPRQQRSRDRVDAIMRALVELVRERPSPGDITTTDVAERAGLPIGSLYVYFEDLRSIVDATVITMLERHDESIVRALEGSVTSVDDIVDRVFDAYARLYLDEPGFVALRGTTLFEPHHMRWLRERVLALVGRTAESLEASGIGRRATDIIERVDLVFVIGDAILLHAYNTDPAGDVATLEQGREILHFALGRLANP